MTKNNKEKEIIKAYCVDFDKFLQKFKVIGKNVTCTHTAYGPPWGKFNIPDEELDEFYNKYRKIVGKIHLYMTERPKNTGPLLVDIDFNFECENKERQYTIDDIKLVINIINTSLKNYYKLTKKKVKTFVFEKSKPSIKKKENREEYKDGFHIIYPYVALSKNMRYLILEELEKIITEKNYFKHIPYTNNLSDVIDKCVVYRNGWMMYGSKKYEGQLYELTHIFKYDLTEDNITRYNKNEFTTLFSNRKYTDEDQLQIRENIDNYNLEKKLENILIKYDTKKKKIELIDDEDDIDPSNNNIYKKSTNESNKNIMIAKKLALILSKKRATEYNTWIRVGWSLHNISHSLLSVFKKFSKKCKSKYDELACENIWENATNDGLGIGSLYLWAYKDNPEAYLKIIRLSINELIQEAETGTEYDIGKVIHELYKYKFKCASIKNNIWYEFQDHRWVEIESAHTLNTKISEELTTEFANLNSYYYHKIALEKGLERDNLQMKAKKMTDIMLNLKKSAFKERVIRECAILFYDSKIEEKLNSNTNLLGFDNGVYDLKNDCFRDGTPDDYVTFSVGYDYKEYDKNDPIMKEIMDYFNKIMQEDIMRKYILTLLSSYLDGNNKDQKFVIWTGNGCHAKGTKIMMHDGILKNVEDIKVGELLMGDDSKPRKVKQLFRGNDDMYKIIPKRGNPYIVNSEHRLALKYIGYNCVSIIKESNTYINSWCEFDESERIKMKQKIFKTKDEAIKFSEENEKINDKFIERGHKLRIKVRDYLRLSSNVKRLFLGYKCPVDFQEKSVDIDPYIIGYWLCDEHTYHNNITTVDLEIVKYFKNFNLTLQKYSAYSCGITSENKYAESNMFINALKKYDLLGNKHIPHDFKCNSRENRLKLLAGIIDSDGHYNNNISNQYEITLKSEQLLDDIIYLARSLGFSAYKSKCKNEPVEGTYYRTIISGNRLEEIPILLERKKAVARKCNRDNLMTSIDVEYVNKDNYYGFHVTGNQYYLMGDFTCTLNSNGKSKTVELMKKILGDYFGTLKNTVLTGKKASSNAASPEMTVTKGKRCIVFQETENDDKINVGCMKELSGGDPIYARPLYKEPIEFIPQFKMILTCNKLPFIPSNDGGTWRRIRVTPWESKFVEIDKNGLYDGKELKPNQFPKDYNLGEKFERWKQAIIWLFLNVYYKNYKKEGIEEPHKVKIFTKKYEKASDIYCEFIEENITITNKEKDKEKIQTMYMLFKNWYSESYSTKAKCPAKKDLQEYLEQHEYKFRAGYIIGIKFNMDEETNVFDA